MLPVKNNEKLKFQCKFNHIWEAKIGHIKNGTWCPECASGSGERLCKYIFEHLFNEKFIRCRPSFLKNDKTCKNLELDGFCEKLKIAFEYNGRQHFSDDSIFERSKYDDLKKDLCIKNDIKLFQINEIRSSLKYMDIVNEILSQANTFKVNIIGSIDALNINDIHYTNYGESQLQIVKNIAKSKNGICLSNKYIDSDSKLEFKCNICDHVWLASFSKIKFGRWCPSCSNSIKKTLEDAKILAESKGGKVLSTEFKNVNTKILWECNKGHQWLSNYNNVNTGFWCRKCADQQKQKYRIEDLQLYAENKGGICFDNEYIPGKNMHWKCLEGHEWFRKGDFELRYKKWCPTCNKINQNKR